MSSVPINTVTTMTRSDFPDDFVFGAATAAYQVEGAAALDGRAPSLWDVFAVQKPKYIKGGSNGNVAVDQYHRYKEDVAIMKKIGLGAYRFSISWSRVLPGGRLSAGVNKQGVQYYNNLIDELLKNEIVPYVTLFHWDVPQALEDEYGGFLDRKIIKDFCEFADLCFWEFGDRVKNWITLNEPWSFAVGGYAGRGMPPCRGFTSEKFGSLMYGNDEVPMYRSYHFDNNCDENGNPRSYRKYDESGIFRSYRFDHNYDESGNPGTEPYTVGHNLILAHGEAYHLYHDKYKCQGGRVGITLVSEWFIPFDKTSTDDIEACHRAVDFFFGWYMAPITYGAYPKRMRDTVSRDRLPKFTKKESDRIKMSYDFLGLNYYTARYAQDISKQPISVVSYNTDSKVNHFVHDIDANLIGPKAGCDWLYVYPRGMYDLLKHVQEKYNNPLIYITENGYAEVNDCKLTISEARMDPERISYIHDHLEQVKLAKDENVKVAGYFYWAFIDNYEWLCGYTVRFGMIYADYQNDLARCPKDSALWYMNFIKKCNVKGLLAPEPVKTPTPVGTKRPNSGDTDESSKRKVIYKV